MKFFAILTTVLGLTAAQVFQPKDIPIKQNLLQSLERKEKALVEAVDGFSARGFDYFAEQLNKTVAHVRAVHADVLTIPDNTAWKDAGKWIAQSIDIDRETPLLMQYPVMTEAHKSDALYLAIVKTAQRDISAPSPAILVHQVADIVAQEDLAHALNLTSTNTNEIQAAGTKLHYMYEVLLNLMSQKKNLASPTKYYEFNQSIKIKTEELLKQNKTEQAQKLNTAWDELMKANLKVGKIFPIDSQTRINEYMNTAPEFYRNWQHVNDLAFYSFIDCSGNKCKKPNRHTD